MKIFILLLGLCHLVEPARILAFLPFPAKSHQRVIQPLIRELSESGHHVTCVTPYPLDNPPQNYSVIEVPDFYKNITKEISNDQGNVKDWFILLKNPVVKIFGAFWKLMGLNFIKSILTNENVRRLIESDLEFDLVLLETTFLQEPFIALGHKFNAPVIEYVPAGNHLWTYWLHGNPHDTSYIEDCSLPFTDRMTFVQRTFNTFMALWSRFINLAIIGPIQQSIMDEHIRYPGWENRPSMLDMIRNTSLVLVNTHFSINYPYPSAPQVKDVGGLNIVQPKLLPKDLQDFMDSAKDGVIYFTLGSHLEVSSILSEEQKLVFSKVFSELKQKVLWKWETEFPDTPSNVKISKWFPQQDILAHKNCKLFITHGGMLSITEAIYQGIPVVGIPIMPDQDKNVVHAEHYKYGVQLQPYNITYQSLKWAVNEVLNNPLYAKNAKKRSELFRDKPETALETAVYWTEYVLRHKGAHHLKPAISTMPWYQQAMIDVYAAILLIILIPIYIIYRISKFTIILILKLVKKVPKSNNKSEKKKKNQ